MNFRGRVSVAVAVLMFIFRSNPAVLAQDESRSSYDPVESLLKLTESEKSKGEWIFYRQRFRDRDNQWAQYQGSIYAVLKSLKIDKCQVDLETIVVDHFRGIVGKSDTGEQQDTTTYLSSFALAQALADTMHVIEARPAQLRRATRSVCDERPSCELSWIQMKSEGRSIKEKIMTNDQLEFAGLSRDVAFPVSSPDAGAAMIRDFKALVNSKCR